MSNAATHPTVGDLDPTLFVVLLQPTNGSTEYLMQNTNGSILTRKTSSSALRNAKSMRRQGTWFRTRIMRAGEAYVRNLTVA